ncbi:MAG: deoxyguanosinetriphosphate triphosphohydrolase [Clostridia bacterium]
MTIKEITEQNEAAILLPYACLSKNSKGREKEDRPEQIRTCFQRDRDRIIHSKAFRRLMHKTQVFLSPEGDHYRTRLTHTLEVSQIARTVAIGLRVNQDLTEAVSLGHDLGHTPFGHAGERALNDILTGGFRHYEHSVRVAQVLEKNGKGLNLTYEVLDGIGKHTGGIEASTTEGRIVRYADRIAYMNHDIDDAITAKVMSEEDIPKEIVKVLGDTKTKRITSFVNSLITNSKNGELDMDADTKTAYYALHKFMYSSVYLNPYAKREERKIPHIIESLFSYYLKHTELLPDNLKIVANNEGEERAVADFIAGMSDRYAIVSYENLFIPKSWNIGM